MTLPIVTLTAFALGFIAGAVLVIEASLYRENQRGWV